MPNTKHAVIRTDLMTGTDVAADLRSVRYLADGATPTNIDNGCLVLLDGLMDGERELYKGLTPAADSPKKNLVVIATPEIMYDERLKGLVNFYNVAGSNCRGYVLHENDIFSVTAEALTGTPVVGSIIEAAADVKMSVVDDATGATKIGEVIAVEAAGALTYYVIRVCD